MQSKQELDIYIDETGDSSPYCIENPLYIISFVCVESTDQNVNSIQSFQQKLSGHNGGDHFIHTGNLVRKEHPYKELTIQERQSLFGCMFFFSKKARFRYFNAVIDKNRIRKNPCAKEYRRGLFIHSNRTKDTSGTFPSFASIMMAAKRFWATPSVLPAVPFFRIGNTLRRSRKNPRLCNSPICSASWNWYGTKRIRDRWRKAMSFSLARNEKFTKTT